MMKIPVTLKFGIDPGFKPSRANLRFEMFGKMWLQHVEADEFALSTVLKCNFLFVEDLALYASYEDFVLYISWTFKPKTRWRYFSRFNCVVQIWETLESLQAP